MWQRNVLFVGLVGGAVVALGANLIPPREPQLLGRYDAGGYHTPEVESAVERVNVAFRTLWQKEKLRPAESAPDLTIARRLALGLMGTVPSLEEIRQFEHLPSDERLAWWLDHILADRRCADYLAERFARACVGTEDGPFIFYRRHRLVSWLSDQFQHNRPYDEVVRDLIVSSGLWTDHAATNFVTVTVQPDNQNQPDPVRLAGRVTRAFLGLRLDCAQCHNHPYAAWKQADFQALSAFFAQTHLGFTGIHDGSGEYEPEDRKTGKKKVVAPRVPFAADLLPAAGSRREQLAAWVTDPRNPYFARAVVNRVWALMLGRPLIEPVDNLESSTAGRDMLQVLADDFLSHNFDLQRLIRVISACEVFRMDSAADGDATEEHENAWAVFPMTRLRPEQVVGSLLQAASVRTIDSESHLLVRLARFGQQNEFMQRYGDTGEDEFGGHGGTIPQRLLLMNGGLIEEKTKENLFNAATRIAWQAQDDGHAIETAYLAILTRRPTPEEAAHFRQALADERLGRPQRLEDLYWALLNATEFSWNH
jgi:hypothetical protein